MARQGNAYVQYTLSEMLAQDGTVERDEEEAVKWLRRSAEQGYTPAQRALGRRYASGRGVPESFEEAEKWFRRCEKEKLMLEFSELMEKAKRGDADAQYWLGHSYDTGFLVERNHEKAAQWYRKSAEQGERYAQRYLGFLYLDGHGVEQSDEEAAKWLEKAAAQGDYRHEGRALEELYQRRFFEHMKQSLLAQKRLAG
jgi:TPR repeat protein